MVRKQMVFCLFASCVTYNVIASNSFYVGGKTGWTHFSKGCESHRLGCDQDEMGAGIYLGYMINDWLAIEGGYDYFGKAQAIYPSINDSLVKAPYSAEVRGIELGLKSEYYLTKNLSILGKVGALGWKIDKIGEEFNNTVNVKDKDISLMLGTGLEYRLARKWGARIEYQWFDNVGSKDTGGSDINFLTLGLIYSFGAGKEEAITEPLELAPTKVIEEKVVTFDELKGEVFFAFDSSETYNQGLSMERAKSVSNYFKSKLISDRLQAKGMGESSLVADNSIIEGSAMNRRVDVISPSFFILEEHE